MFQGMQETRVQDRAEVSKDGRTQNEVLEQFYKIIKLSGRTKTHGALEGAALACCQLYNELHDLRHVNTIVKLSKFSRVSSKDQYIDNRLYAQQIVNDKPPDFAFFKNQRRPNANDLPIILKNSKDILHGRQVYTSNYVKARHNHCVACNSDKDHAKDKGKRLFFQRASSTLASNAGECRGVTA